MLIKITKSCSNGCIHCLNDSKPCDDHMTIETFRDVLYFCKKYDNDLFGNMITGGEPTEHPKFLEFIDEYYKMFSLDTILSILTNGHWIINNQDIVLDLINKFPYIFFQVTYDSKYYPKKLDTTKRILRNPHVILCEKVDIYPQGRALSNKIPCSDKYKNPKCINSKLAVAQMINADLSEVLAQLRIANKHYIPAIHIDGSIGFGESDLCPRTCTIYNNEKEIRQAMLFNNCIQCKFKQQNLMALSIIENGKKRWK